MDIRQLGPDDDLEVEVDLGRRAFGPVSEAAAPGWIAEARAAAEGGRYFAAFDGPRPAGVAMFQDMRQWWHGRAVRMAGVGAVKVAPEQRGRGTGRTLMTEVLHVIADRGYPLSVLYPATAPLYRSLGWELAGGMYRGVIQARSLASLLPPDGPAGPLPALPGLRRAGPDDADEIIAVLGAVHETARHCGPATYDAATVRRWWLSDENRFCYLADDGFLAYGWDEGHREISVRVALAGSPETTRALWSIVGSHAPMARLVRAVVSPDDPVAWLTREPDLGLESRWQWMLRVVDAPAAIAGRGFPGAVTLTVGLQIDDAQLPANAGHWTLELSGGKGVLTHGPAPVSADRPVRLGARGFASLYGGVPMDTLRRAGLATGGDRDADEALNAAFAGKAFLLDSF
ncbi:MAG TPA: GNAT family N-acetyltransferase [Streptosporangiaceae bacterium]|nr:GNAT family N-acetyltransferase [Streptosporangiaceae bacterium]